MHCARLLADLAGGRAYSRRDPPDRPGYVSRSRVLGQETNHQLRATVSWLMTPQSNFMVLAPVAAGRVGDLRQLLASMNRAPGIGDPQNPLVPFAHLETLHFARLVVLEDVTQDDITAYGLPQGNYPTYLAFLGDFDGPFDAFLAELVQNAGDGLRRIFSYCEGFLPGADLLGWIKAHNATPATIYVNWIGRTVRQVGEEAALHDALVSYVQRNAEALTAMPPAQAYTTLRLYATS